MTTDTRRLRAKRLAATHDASKTERIGWGTTARSALPSLTSAMTELQASENPWDGGIIRDRAALHAGAVARLRAALDGGELSVAGEQFVGSVLHMSLNRLLTPLNGRVRERACLDLLRRFDDAQQRRSIASGAPT